MKKWKVLFIGIGSIAKRHIKNLAILMKQRNENLEIDVFRSKSRSKTYLPEEIRALVGTSYYDLNATPNDYDVIFITNPTQYHLETIREFNDKGRHFFIEKPLCTLLQLNSGFYKGARGRVYYVAAPLRYTAIIEYIKTNVDVDNVLSVRCISSSYLPDWRKGSDYRMSYSAKKELGGGVSIDLVHEWDYITYLFGFPEHVKSFIRKESDLEIDSDDIAIYIAEYSNMLVEVHVDYIGRVPIREMQIFCKTETITCDFLKSIIRFENNGEQVVFGEKRDDYQVKELQYFFESITKARYGLDSIQHAEKVLRIAGGIYEC